MLMALELRPRRHHDHHRSEGVPGGAGGRARQSGRRAGGRTDRRDRGGAAASTMSIRSWPMWCPSWCSSPCCLHGHGACSAPGRSSIVFKANAAGERLSAHRLCRGLRADRNATGARQPFDFRPGAAAFSRWWLRRFSSILPARCFSPAIGSLSLMLLTGYCGQISLGHSGLLAAGAFTVGISVSRSQCAVLDHAAACRAGRRLSSGSCSGCRRFACAGFISRSARSRCISW